MASNMIIIDCDAGVDDCQALVMALTAHARGEVTIAAITCVSGNVGVDKVVRNVRRCIAVVALQMAVNRDSSGGNIHVNAIPVLKGCHEPLILEDGETVADAQFWHGRDGLGNASHAVDAGLLAAGVAAETVATFGTPDAQHAVQGMINICEATPGAVTICALGPLTNIAMACKMSPSFSATVRHLVFMGGTRFARGNASLTAEFNAFVDPESLQIALRYFRGASTMVGWDLTARHGVPFEFVEQTWMGDAAGGIAGSRPAASFLAMCSTDIIQKSRAGPWGAHGLLIPDPLAMAVALDPASVVADSTECWATVETSGKRTRGMVIIDYDNLFASKRRTFRAKNTTPGSEQDDEAPPVAVSAAAAAAAATASEDKEKKLRVVTQLNMERVQHWLVASTATRVE